MTGVGIEGWSNLEITLAGLGVFLSGVAAVLVAIRAGRKHNEEKEKDDGQA